MSVRVGGRDAGQGAGQRPGQTGGRGGVLAAARDAVPPDLVLRVQQRLAGLGAPPSAAAVAAAVRAEAGVLLSDAQMLRTIRALHHELIGAGPLATLLADPMTTDVIVNAPDDVRIDRGQGWEATTVRFADDEAVQRLARRLAAAAGRRLDDAQPFVDARLPDGTRLHAVLPPLSAGSTLLSLRVLRPAQFDLTALGRSGAFAPSVEVLLRRIVAARLAFLVSGGTGSGKTTLLAAMLREVSPDERIITVEDAGELRPPHPHLVHLVARHDNVEGVGRVEQRELIRQALRMRPDRVVVGEVRGPEVIDLLIALNTGHRGGAGTVHANTAADVPARLAALAALGGVTEGALHSQLAGAVQVILQVERRDGGGPGQAHRVLSEIAVVGPGVLVQSAYDGRGRAGPGADQLARMLGAGEGRGW